MKWNPEDYARTQMLSCSGREIEAELNLQGNDRSWMSAGDGKITADFAATLPRSRVTGVDSSPEMIAYATRTYASKQYPTFLSLVLMHSLDFDQEFDLCFQMPHCTGLIPPAFLNGASRSLRCGRIVISCGGRGDAADVFASFSELASCEAESYFDGFHNPFFSMGIRDYSLWLEKAGFNVEQRVSSSRYDASW